MLKGLKIKIAAQPIIWSNDDFFDLGGDTPLETCLAEMREAGYAGTELGHKFPKDSKALGKILNKYDLQLVTGWHSTYLATNDFKKETADFKNHLQFLKEMGSKVVIVAECSHRTYNDPKLKLNWEGNEAQRFTPSDWTKVFKGLDEFSSIAEGEGLKLVYHHHMGTAIQSLREIDKLMENTKNVNLLGDTGHLAFAGENPLNVFKKYKNRLGHVHLKNIRPEVVKQARTLGYTFEKSVKEGVFTVPGDGGIPYQPIFEVLKEIKYEGWMVVEAEQDPTNANPLEYALKARDHIRKVAGI
jgi:inosose dehydratase